MYQDLSIIIMFNGHWCTGNINWAVFGNSDLKWIIVVIIVSIIIIIVVVVFIVFVIVTLLVVAEIVAVNLRWRQKFCFEKEYGIIEMFLSLGLWRWFNEGD